MIIVFISLLAVAESICWALCASITPEPGEDEEQERYLAEWERKHEKWKNG